MKKISVSVIVPMYNRELYIEECINSILNQTIESMELIIVDDGSTDYSKELCEKYLSDERVSYYYQENEGLAAARDTGIKHATGEYIGFVDSDDWVDLDMYERMYEVAKQYDADVVFCNRMYNNDSYSPPKDLPTGYYNREKILAEVLPKSLAYITDKGYKGVISWSNCRRIYRRSLLEENNISFDRRFRRSQDLQLTYEAMLCAKGFYYMGEDYFYHVRIVDDSLSRGYTNNMWNLYIPLIERLYKDTEEFTEVNLMDQMHLRAFFFVIQCIENEFKSLCPNDKKTSIKIISEIMNHPICEKYYGHIEVDKLSLLYQEYYKLIKDKKAEKLYSYAMSEKRKETFIGRHYKLFVNFVTESKLTGWLYRLIRGKR